METNNDNNIVETNNENNSIEEPNNSDKNSKKVDVMKKYMAWGICIGALYGVIFHNIAVGLSIGLLLGVAWGSFQQGKRNK